MNMESVATAFMRLSCWDAASSVPAATTNTERSYAVCIYIREHRQVIDHAAHIFDAILGIIPQSGRATAFALVAGISRDGYIAKFSQFLCVKPSDLLLGTAIRVCYRHRRIFLFLIEICGQVKVCRHLNPVYFVLDRLDVHLALHVFLDGTLIHESELVCIFTCGTRHDSSHKNTYHYFVEFSHSSPYSDFAERIYLTTSGLLWSMISLWPMSKASICFISSAESAKSQMSIFCSMRSL